GAGNDTINASQGADLISGGGGGDTLTGNGGDDTFLYSAVGNSTPAEADLITDFTSGDLISLSGIDADTGTSGNQAFSFIGASAFSTTAGELRAVNTSGNDWRVEADNDGDGTADLEIDVTTADGNSLDAGDFVL
ncbi:MAG: M10 family metallopeptidase C-terminal domain-containing protein, partial [Pseudomonadota bacterium]